MNAQRETVGTMTGLADANLFEISGPIVINYSTSSITGDPRFSYTDAERRSTSPATRSPGSTPWVASW